MKVLLVVFLAVGVHYALSVLHLSYGAQHWALVGAIAIAVAAGARK